EHNPQHREGVRYRDQGSQKKFGDQDRVAARDRANRDVSRGLDQGGRGSTGDRGGRGSPGNAGGRGSAATRPSGGRGEAGGPGGRGDRGSSAAQRPASRPGGGGARPQTGQRD